LDYTLPFNGISLLIERMRLAVCVTARMAALHDYNAAIRLSQVRREEFTF
jgi:hypothetical protein